MTAVRDRVNEAFRRLAAGELPVPKDLEDSGWDTVLPSGRRVTRGELQTAAAEIVGLGIEAVPSLLDRVAQDNAALRYVAMYSLEKITGVKSGLSPFIADDRDGALSRAIAAWRAAGGS